MRIHQNQLQVITLKSETRVVRIRVKVGSSVNFSDKEHKLTIVINCVDPTVNEEQMTKSFVQTSDVSNQEEVVLWIKDHFDPETQSTCAVTYELQNLDKTPFTHTGVLSIKDEQGSKKLVVNKSKAVSV